MFLVEQRGAGSTPDLGEQCFEQTKDAAAVLVFIGRERYGRWTYEIDVWVNTVQLGRFASPLAGQKATATDDSEKCPKSEPITGPWILYMVSRKCDLLWRPANSGLVTWLYRLTKSDLRLQDGISHQLALLCLCSWSQCLAISTE